MIQVMYQNTSSENGMKPGLMLWLMLWLLVDDLWALVCVCV